MAVAKRTRLEGLALNSWEDVDRNLKEIGLIDIEVGRMEDEYNKTVADLKEKLQAKAAPLLERKARLELEIKEFAEANRQSLAGKSKLLNFGSVGFRQSTKVIIRNMKAILEALKARNMFDCIITKEQVSKDALKAYPDEVLSQIGVTKKVEDTFWYEINRDTLQRV